MGTWSLFRCQACSRIISVRSRHCPRCKQWTGVGHADPSLDRRLEALRAFGVFAGLWAVVTAFVLMIHFLPAAAAATGALAVTLLVAHLLLPWHAAGWVLAEVAWGLAAALCAVTLRKAGWGALLTVIPVGLLATMLASRRRYLGRLCNEPSADNPPVPSQVPSRGPCTSCDGRGADIVAPIYVVSVGWITFRDTGLFRNLCPACARTRAIPASLATLALGWWGIPWGLIWTPQAVIDNLTHGGVTLDSSEYAALRQRATQTGSEGFAGPLAWVGGLLLLPAAIGLAVIPHLAAMAR